MSFASTHQENKVMASAPAPPLVQSREEIEFDLCPLLVNLNILPTTPFPFFRLPGELRNRIYRVALVSKVRLYFSGAAPPEPHFLHVCKQIRYEAMSIFYNENRFTVQIADYDNTDFVQWHQQCLALEKKYKLASIYRSFQLTSRVPHWERVHAWLRMYHEGTVTTRLYAPSSAPGSFSLEMVVLGGIFHMVGELKTRRWKRVDKILEEQHQVLVKMDPRWA